MKHSTTKTIVNIIQSLQPFDSESQMFIFPLTINLKAAVSHKFITNNMINELRFIHIPLMFTTRHTKYISTTVYTYWQNYS